MKTLQNVGVLVFFSILLVPSVVWFGFMDGDHGRSLENRPLAVFPEISTAGWDGFLPQVDAWYTDNAPFKSDAVRLKNSFMMSLFNEVQSDDVMVGQDGWLYYKKIGDGDPLRDYKGLLSFTDEELENYLGYLRSAKDNLDRQGIEFYVLVAPNKEIVYPQYIPSGIKIVSGETMTSRLGDYLASEGVDYFKYLLDAERNADRITYMQTDTHWNDYGAYLGYLELLDMMGISLPECEPDFVIPNSQSGDLARMVNVPLVERYGIRLKSDLVYEEIGLPTSSGSAASLQKFSSMADNRDSRTMLIIGDSFREALLQFPASDFGEVVAVHKDEFSSELVSEIDSKPDVVVVVLVERNITRCYPALVSLAQSEF